MHKLLAPLASLILVGCSPEPALQRGQSLFSDPTFSPADTNVFSCATCHVTTKDPDPARRLPGYTMFDAAHRPAWWNLKFDYLLDAVNECYVEFMRGPRLATDSTDGRALLVYLDSLAPDAHADALTFTFVENLDAAYYAKLVGLNGDAGRGAVLYKQGCANCHGDVGTGNGRLGPKVTVIPTETITQHGTIDPVAGARPVSVEKVRHGKYLGAGGNMAFYATELLSDQELADILIYMKL